MTQLPKSRKSTRIFHDLRTPSRLVSAWWRCITTNFDKLPGRKNPDLSIYLSTTTTTSTGTRRVRSRRVAARSAVPLHLGASCRSRTAASIVAAGTHRVDLSSAYLWCLFGVVIVTYSRGRAGARIYTIYRYTVNSPSIGNSECIRHERQTGIHVARTLCGKWEICE